MARIAPEIEKLAPYAPGLAIAAIQEKFGVGRVIKLASNENPLGASPLAQEAIARHAGLAFRYPQGGNPRLVDALAALLNIGRESIVVGNGSDEIIDLLIRLTAAPNSNIVCFRPCFGIYPIQAQINGVEIRRLALEPDFSFNFDKLVDLVDANTGLVFITAPDNPSGYCPQACAVADFAAKLALRAPDATLVIDEAYMDFAPDEKAASLLAAGKIPRNVAFLRTLSKSWGLAGMRIGYGVFPPELARAFWKARLPFSVNILAEEAALAALSDHAFREKTLAAVADGRESLKHGLERLGCRVWPSAANFLLFQLPAGFSAGACFEALLAEGVIIRRLNSYDLPEHLRVSIGNREENKIFLEKLKQFLEKK